MEVIFIGGAVSIGFILGAICSHSFFSHRLEQEIQKRIVEKVTEAYVRGETIGFKRASIKYRTEDLLKRDRKEVSDA